MKTLETSPGSTDTSTPGLPQPANPAPQRGKTAVPAGANTAHCSHCNKNVTFHYKTVNHKKQLLLSVFTIGLWLPMWLGMVLCPTRLCDECGGPIWND